MAGNKGNRGEGWSRVFQLDSKQEYCSSTLNYLNYYRQPVASGHAKTDLLAMTGRLGGEEHVGNQKQPSVE